MSELKVAAFPCQVDDLVVPIWPYQFFNVLRSDRRSEHNTVLSGKTTISVLHDVQLLLNKQQQICVDIYIHWHFSSSTDTVVLPNFIGIEWKSLCSELVLKIPGMGINDSATQNERKQLWQCCNQAVFSNQQYKWGKRLIYWYTQHRFMNS